MGESESVVATAIAVSVGGVVLRAGVNRAVKWWGQRAHPEVWDRLAVGIVAALCIAAVITFLRLGGAFS